jgi:hypothetical protein
MRLALPVLARGGARIDAHLIASNGAAQQPQQGMPGVRFDQICMAYGARESDIERIDVKLVHLERFVILVAGAVIIEIIANQVLRTDSGCNLCECRALVGDEPEEYDGFVFQTLGLVNGKDQRSPEDPARLGFVLFPQHQYRDAGGMTRLFIERALDGVLVGEQRDRARLAPDRLDQEIALAIHGPEPPMLDLEQRVGDMGDLLAVPEVGAQHPQLLPRRELLVAPKQSFDPTPGKEIGMDDLIRIAAQEKPGRHLERAQDQQQLRRSEILHLVHHDEVIARHRTI